MDSKLLRHIEEHTNLAKVHLLAALDMIEEPHGGLSSWLIMLGTHLEAAKSEIEKALIAP